MCMSGQVIFFASVCECGFLQYVCDVIERQGHEKFSKLRVVIMPAFECTCICIRPAWG